MMPRRRAACAALTVVLLGITACSGSGAPDIRSTPPAPVPAASDSATAPTDRVDAPESGRPEPPVPGSMSSSVSGAVATSVPGAVAASVTVTAAPSTSPVDTAGPIDPVALPLPQCRAEKLATRTAGVLTIGTPSTRLPPWFDGDPATGRGYESAVGLAVAGILGFRADQVTWVATTASPGSPDGDAGVDVEMGQVVIPAAGQPRFDMSTGYYDISESAVTVSGSSAAPVTAAGLRRARLGVVRGTAGPAAVSEVVKPDHPATAFPSAASAATALSHGGIDALVLSTPEAFTVSGVGSGLVLVGQLPPGKWQPDQFGMVLSKGSSLTPCISAAVDALRVEGDLARLTAEWITDKGAPLLR